MKKGICMLLLASLMICLSACGSKESSTFADEVEAAKSESINDGIIVEEPVQEETDLENAGNIPDGAFTKDSKLSIIVYDKSNADVHYAIDKYISGRFTMSLEENGYTIFYGDLGQGLSVNIIDSNGQILSQMPYDLTDSELTIYLDFSSFSDIDMTKYQYFHVNIDYDGDGGEYLLYSAEDVVTYADANPDDISPDSETTLTEDNSNDDAVNSGNQAQLDNSALASFVGEYRNSNGDSFIIEQDKGTGKYKIYMVKLYSAEGWPEDVDVDGVRFYDTPTIESITGDVNDMIVVETISQYTAAEGTFYLGVNGAADVHYDGYYGYFTK